MKRRVDIERIGNKIRIHYNYHIDWDIAADERFRELIVSIMRRNDGVVTRYNSPGWAWYYDQMDAKRKALNILKKVSNDIEAGLLQNFKVVDMDHPVQQFTTNLFENLREAYQYLNYNHEIKQDEALHILLDILQGWYPDVQRVQEINHAAFKKALQRMR
jgi:hypothetical protein